MTLLDVFEVEKEGEKEAFRKDLPNRSEPSSRSSRHLAWSVMKELGWTVAGAAVLFVCCVCDAVFRTME